MGKVWRVEGYIYIDISIYIYMKKQENQKKQRAWSWEVSLKRLIRDDVCESVRKEGTTCLTP